MNKSVLDIDIIETNDSKTIGLLDVSIYNTDIPIDNPIIEIYVPGSNIAVNPVFLPKQLNAYNSYTLRLSKANELCDLPDGIYKVVYSICPNDKLITTFHFIKVDKLLRKFDKALVKLDKDCSIEDKDLKKLDEIEFLIEATIANTNVCNYERAIKLYNRASNLLDKILCC